MTSGSGDDPREPAWHERTSTLLGASAGALLVLGILYFLLTSLFGGPDEPDPDGQYYLVPSATSSRFSTPTSRSSTTTTTQTITSTSPPATTDIEDPDASTSTTSGTDTSTTSSTTTSTTTTTRTTDGESSSRSRPRFNETRTLYPRP